MTEHFQKQGGSILVEIDSTESWDRTKECMHYQSRIYYGR